jgi:hypothetical protein
VSGYRIEVVIVLAMPVMAQLVQHDEQHVVKVVKIPRRLPHFNAHLLPAVHVIPAARHV